MFIKIGDQKVEDTEKTEGKGVALGKKGPWDQRRDQGSCNPRPACAGPAAGLLGESWVTVPSGAKQGLSNTVRDLVA